MENKKLFCVKTKHTESKSEALAPENAFYGWRPHSENKDRIVNEWDERYRMHSLSAKYLLTWECHDCVGREIVAIWNVKIHKNVIYAENPSGIDLNVGVFATTHPGRGALLGEDGLEEAFGRDAIESCLRSALHGDWRGEYCDVEFKILNDDDAFEKYLDGYEISKS